MVDRSITIARLHSASQYRQLAGNGWGMLHLPQCMQVPDAGEVIAAWCVGVGIIRAMCMSDDIMILMLMMLMTV